tara:strand:- start:6658 stop:7815 length:1158 start_codon:yes stop_codon:yes gene_type:complete
MKFLIFFKKIFTILLFSKLDLLPPKKNKIIVFDQTSSDLIFKYFSKDKVHTLHTRKEKVNLFIAIYNFLRGRFSSIQYFETYIDFVNPSLIVTFENNSSLFYNLRKNPKRKKIVIVSTWRTAVHDFGIFKNEKNTIKVLTGKNYNVDRIYVYNDSIGKLFKRLNADRVETIGSFRSNYYQFKNILKDKEILFISSFVKTTPNRMVTDEIDIINFNNYQSVLIKNLARYGKKYNTKITILGKYTGKLANNEFNYFNLFFKNSNWNFLKSDDVNSYEMVDSSKLVVGLNSTLVYESFSRGNRTIFFDIRSHLESLKTLKFAWPVENLEKNGPFWTTNSSFEALESILNNIKNMDNQDWEDLSKKYRDLIMPRDNKNLLFKSFIKDYQ